MPFIDVSDLLDDADIAGEVFNVYRRSVSAVNGRAVTVEAPPVSVIGSIQPAGANALRTLPEGDRVEGAISVITRYRLQMLQTDQQPDEIDWNGRRYKVSNLADWTHYGAGFVNATCTLVEFTDNPR